VNLIATSPTGHARDLSQTCHKTSANLQIEDSAATSTTCPMQAVSAVEIEDQDSSKAMAR
jgi:hypothetical protein